MKNGINRGANKSVQNREKVRSQEDNNVPWISNGVMCWVQLLSLLLIAFIAEQQCDFSDD